MTHPVPRRFLSNQMLSKMRMSLLLNTTEIDKQVENHDFDKTEAHWLFKNNNNKKGPKNFDSIRNINIGQKTAIIKQFLKVIL